MTNQTETPETKAPTEAGGQVERVVVLPLEVARIVRNVFLPRNPNKLRGAHPDTVSAAKAYIAAFEDIERQHCTPLSGAGHDDK